LEIRDSLLSWSETAPARLLRDPFAWRGGAQSASAQTQPATTLFRLQAISIDADKAYAVVNRQVVRPGEKVGDHLVERILATEVWMRGPAGERIVIRLAR
jgi:hypothetical protein